ncbi:hypothetical protein GGH14_000520 [Coemansia sp. RSA 370]|nr:hypothetical protein GGH14_000520 [Coemansia sp. RSA 370]
MELRQSLLGHDGCVNALCWSNDGQYLFSGSDDSTICIWRAAGDGALLSRFRTGFHERVFDLKQMLAPNQNMLIACSMDHSIKLFDIHTILYMANSARVTGNTTRPSADSVLEGNSYCVRTYAVHNGPVKRAAVIPDAPFEFLTCSEDGTVRHFDIREHSPSVPAGQRRRIREGRIVADYSSLCAEVHALDVNWFHPTVFAAGGSMTSVMVHDRRMPKYDVPGRAVGSGSRKNWASDRCIVRLRRDNPDSRRNMLEISSNETVTGLRFSRDEPNLVIASWCYDYVYLFDLNRSSAYSGAINDNSCTFRKSHRCDSADSTHFTSAKRIRIDSASALAQYEDDVVDRVSSRGSNRESYMYGSDEEADLLSSTSSPRDSVHAREFGRGLYQGVRMLTEDEAPYLFSNSSSSSIGNAASDWYYMYICSVCQRDTRNYDTITSRLSAQNYRASDRMSSLSSVEAALIAESLATFVSSMDSHALSQALASVSFALRSLDGEGHHTVDSSHIAMLSLGEGPASEEFKRVMLAMYSDPSLNPLDDSGSNDNPTKIRLRAEFGDMTCRVREIHVTIHSHWMTVQTEAKLICDLRRLLLVTDDDIDCDKTMAYLLHHNEVYFGVASNYANTLVRDATTILGLFDQNSDILSTEACADIDTTSCKSVLYEMVRRWEALSAVPHDSRVSFNTFVSRANVFDDSLFGAVDDLTATPCLYLWHRSLYGNITDMTGLVSNSDRGDHGEPSMLPVDEHKTHIDTDQILPASSVFTSSQPIDTWPQTTREYLPDILYTPSVDDSDDTNSQVCLEDSEGRDSDLGPVPVILPCRRYWGHCNAETIKDVNFVFDRYVASGSDDGCMFIWDRQTMNIVQLVRGDSDVVNIIEGHPVLPIIAVSGIGSDVQIFHLSQGGPAAAHQRNFPMIQQTHMLAAGLHDPAARQACINRAYAADQYASELEHAGHSLLPQGFNINDLIPSSQQLFPAVSTSMLATVDDVTHMNEEMRIDALGSAGLRDELMRRLLLSERFNFSESDSSNSGSESSISSISSADDSLSSSDSDDSSSPDSDDTSSSSSDDTSSSDSDDTSSSGMTMMAQKVLDKASKERTTLTVAYRLSMIQDCDMIVVFKNCRIVEHGTHDELLALKGTY